MIEYRKININEERKLRNLIDTVLSGLERKEFFIPFNEEELKDMFNQDKVIIYGAFDGEELVGTAQLYFDESYTKDIKEILNMNNCKMAELGGYLVLDQYRNQGIMKVLQDRLINELKNINYEYAIITVHPDNIASNKTTEYTGAKNVKTTMLGNYLRNIYLLKL